MKGRGSLVHPSWWSAVHVHISESTDVKLSCMRVPPELQLGITLRPHTAGLRETGFIRIQEELGVESKIAVAVELCNRCSARRQNCGTGGKADGSIETNAPGKFFITRPSGSAT